MGAGAVEHPLAVHARVHAHALRIAGATTERVSKVLQLGRASAVANCKRSAGRLGSADARCPRRQQQARRHRHGARRRRLQCAAAPIAVPRYSSGLPLKKLGLQGLASLQGFNVYFTLKRSVKRGTELLLFYRVRGARCKCRRSLHTTGRPSRPAKARLLLLTATGAPRA